MQIAQNEVQIAVLCNGNQFLTMHMQPPFRFTNNPRENWKFEARLASDGKKRTHNVKIYAKNITTIDEGWI